MISGNVVSQMHVAHTTEPWKYIWKIIILKKSCENSWKQNCTIFRDISNVCSPDSIPTHNAPSTVMCLARKERRKWWFGNLTLSNNKIFIVYTRICYARVFETEMGIHRIRIHSCYGYIYLCMYTCHSATPSLVATVTSLVHQLPNAISTSTQFLLKNLWYFRIQIKCQHNCHFSCNIFITCSSIFSPGIFWMVSKEHIYNVFKYKKIQKKEKKERMHPLPRSSQFRGPLQPPLPTCSIIQHKVNRCISYCIK